MDEEWNVWQDELGLHLTVPPGDGTFYSVYGDDSEEMAEKILDDIIHAALIARGPKNKIQDGQPFYNMEHPPGLIEKIVENIVDGSELNMDRKLQ